jgi:hypothetical protein
VWIIRIQTDNHCKKKYNYKTIFVSQRFDTEPLLLFAEDMFVPKFNDSLPVLSKHLRKSLEARTKWTKNSGLKVNYSKTELCLFRTKDVAQVTVLLEGVKILKKAFNAIKLIHNFNKYELLQLL